MARRNRVRMAHVDAAPQFGRRDPDARGYFGAFGGRFVPETLVAPIEALERRLPRGARQIARSGTSSTGCCTHYVGRPTPLYESGAPVGAALRRRVFSSSART